MKRDNIKINPIDKSEELSTNVKLIKRFDTEGYAPYDVARFKEQILDQGVNVGKIIDRYFEMLIIGNEENFSVKEMGAHSMMRAWLHCDYDHASKFILEKFDFRCHDSVDFLIKYKFLNFVSVLIFENMHVDENLAIGTPIVDQERSVFEILRQSTQEKKGSFLLDYFAEDFLSVIDKKKSSVTGGRLELVPFEIAPGIFAMDRKSAFVMVNENNLSEDNLYISRLEDYEEIKSIILNESGFLNQEDFHRIEKHFSPINMGIRESHTDFEIYRKLQEPYHRDRLFEKTGIPINKFPIKQQFFFLNHMKFSDENNLEQLKNLYRKHNEIGVKTFLSLEHGGSDMGQKILDLSEKLPQETASKIFSKYAEIIDSVENVLHVAQNGFKTSIETKPELMQSIEQSLYKRGADLLDQFHENINQNPEEIIAELERINADTITTLSIFKYAAKFGNKLPLEDIAGAKFSKKTGGDLEPAEINEMEHIYQANWKTYGNQELIQSVIHKFKESLTGDRAEQEQVYLFKKNDQINAFVKFSELHPGVKYASALNVDQSSKGFGLGETMMDEALYREAQENILIATCDPYNDSNMRYMEKGFIGTGFTGDNPPVMNICWNESKNVHITSKYISSDDLVIMYLKQQIPNTMIIKKADDLHHLHSDFPTGKSLTRCFRDPLQKGSWYAVYETVDSEYETSIKTTE